MKNIKPAAVMCWLVIGAVSLFGEAFASGVHCANQGKMLLVLQCGSDWCESGEDVRRVFEGREFRRYLGRGYAFAVYDDMDSPTPAVSAQNKSLADLRVKSKRFPAITCLTRAPRRFFAQIENIPFDVKAKDLADSIVKAAKKKDEAYRLFSKAKRSSNEKTRADSYGKAFELLTGQVGEFNEKAIREGKVAWKEEWDALAALDKEDRFGWRFRFERGIGVEFVEKATKFRTSDDFAGGVNFINGLRRIPSEHFTTVQKQMVDMAEYALWRKDSSRDAENRKLLHRVLSLGRDTIWGRSALGYLRLAGENLEPGTQYRAPVRSRPKESKIGAIPYPILKLEGEVAGIVTNSVFTEKQKLSIARYAVLRNIGEEGWTALVSRSGAKSFIKAFFADRRWMEDFLWSGKCENWGKALLALESIVFQDGGRWAGLDDSTGRRFATALALEHVDKDEAWFADMVDAYRATALSKRLHRRALDQKVWQWRIAISHTLRGSTGHGLSLYDSQYLRDLPAQQRFFDKYVNAPYEQYAGTCWIVPYRGFNCFGEDVQGPRYYESWLSAGSLHRWASVQIGGVCGELSKFGSACGNAHGLPSAPVGQPGHCALTRRSADGTWVVEYSVTRGTGFSSILPFGGTEKYTYFQAHEGMFEGEREPRLDADRLLTLASFAESKQFPADKINAVYAAASHAWPRHYAAWRLRADWLKRSGRPLAEWRVFADECTHALKGWRQPLWDLLSLYFSRVAKEKGNGGLAEEIVRIIPSLRQSADKIHEEGFFDRAIADWTRPMKDDLPLMERVMVAALDAQNGTVDYFSQVVSWCLESASKDEALLDRFASLLVRFSPADGNIGKSKVDFGKFILDSSRSGNMSVYRQMAKLQKRFSPPEVKGRPYPVRDFGGELVSADGMLQTSTTSPWESPGQYAFALDETPLYGNAFHTHKEKSPWATAVLAGPCRISGVVVVNKTPSEYYRQRQPPIEIQLSEDGKEWETVFRDSETRDEYRVDLVSENKKAKYVRVRRTPDVRDDVFHLNKILVYGRRLY